ncbi:MAG TPA: glutamyl-tRNA reductase [Candidatus Binatia bacterium]|jgi:glutamyl-tRNA reductase
MEREVLIVGVNHRKAPVEIRERLTFSDGLLEKGLRELATLRPVDEGVIVSTCNRVEVVVATKDGDSAIEALTEFLASGERIAREQLSEHLSVYRGREAVRHLFRVAASLDSMVVGEPQILGQLKDSYTHAASAGSAGTVLHRCFHKSFSVAKRVRTETGVASKAVSVSAAAVELASKIFDRLEDKTALLLGAGTMSELAARHLLAHGVRSLVVANRTFDRAVELAREFHGTPVPFEDFPRYLQTADVVIGSTAADGYILTPARVQEVLRGRNYRPMFLIDLSVPRNFDPAINDIDNVYLYDIDDLGGVAQVNREERSREAEKAEAIVEAEVDAFWKWLRSLDAVPTIVALRDKMEAIRKGELEKTLPTLRDLSPREREALEAMTAAIVNKILHAPITHLKQHQREHEAFYVAAARLLFDVEEADDQ